jgi:hypothetical protein
MEAGGGRRRGDILAGCGCGPTVEASHCTRSAEMSYNQLGFVLTHKKIFT